MDGLVKDRTQCAPNGYYFIPVYDKVIFCRNTNVNIYKIQFLQKAGQDLHSFNGPSALAILLSENIVLFSSVLITSIYRVPL